MVRGLNKLRQAIRRPNLDAELDKRKTAAMFMLERKYGKSIIELLSDTTITGYQLAHRLGIDPYKLSRWRKRLGIKARPTGRRRLIDLGRNGGSNDAS